MSMGKLISALIQESKGSISTHGWMITSTRTSQAAMFPPTGFMKPVLFWGIVATALCLSADSASGALADGLNSSWTFDEVSGGFLHDSSGRGNNGTLVNFP